MRSMRGLSVFSILLLGACNSGEQVISEPKNCAAMADLKIADVRIDAAEEIPGDGTWKFPQSPFNMFLGPNAASKHTFCRVAGVIEDEVGFEVWLPPEWNGRLQSVGNGGFTGAIAYPAMHDAVAGGYAAAGTDTGHKTPEKFFNTDWISPERPEQQENFARRAHHLLAVNAKKVVEAFYSEPAHHAYYTGCSSGGWQGLTEAQQYPTDYDGIVAGAPANNFVRLQTRGYYTSALLRASGGEELNADDIALLVKGAYNKCDPADGVTDGIISNPEACDFDPVDLQCGASGANACLSPEKVERARLLYGPLQSPGGLQLYPGNAYGVPAFFVFEEDGEDSGPAIAKVIPETERDWTPETFDPDRDIPPLENQLNDVWGAWKTDLTEFRESGGKLIVYHGWTDPILSPYNTLQYRKELAQTMGEDALPDFYRLYMAPGMDHCGGGVGPSRFDALGALVKWVEEGEAPTTLVASGVTVDGEPRTRLLCNYPQVAVYDGEGDPDNVDSYSCGSQ